MMIYHALYLSLLASIFCVEIEGSADVIVTFYLLMLKELCHEICQMVIATKLVEKLNKSKLNCPKRLKEGINTVSLNSEGRSYGQT